jgi:class 3 adenylate cyclase
VSNSPFAPYVPRLAAGWVGPLARELDGSLASLDISGFTALSERLQARGRSGAEELVALINPIFERLIAVADRYGGDVLKFRGDALLIFYSGEEHTARAYAATTEMQALIAATGDAASSIGPVSLRASSGIYSGACQFFLVEALHTELLVAGAAGTETLRLESDAEAGQILLNGPVPRGAPVPYREPPAPPAGKLDRFVPEAWRAQLLEGGAGEHRLVTAAFLEFGGVGQVLARDGLDGLHTELTALALLVDTTGSELGVNWLDSDIGSDGGRLFVVGGAPASTGEHEERVVRLSRRVLDENPGALTLRAGINRGSAFCGEVGARSRRTYTVMGDTVNLAARLTARAEAGEILAGAEVLDRVRTRYESRPQRLLLKGKEDAVAAFRVGAATGEGRDENAAQLPLVGRETELAALGEAIDGVRMRRQQLVELVGEPGIGKSRLVDELRRRAVGFTQLEARCDPYTTARPYFALRAIMRPLAGLTSDLDDVAAGASLGSWVQAVMPDLAPWLPLLAIPFGAEVEPTPETEQIDPAFRHERLLDAVEQVLSRVLMMPTLIVVEDIHWADDASLELLRHLVRLSAQRPWLICVTRRPQGVGLARDIEGHAQLSLERLPEEGTRLLALAVAGEVALSSAALAGVGEQSGGNPLFIRELVNAARGGGLDALPETVETVITSRIDTLAPEDRFLLRNVSVIGTSFELDLVDEVLSGEVEDTAVGGRWEPLGEFVSADGGAGLRFVHDLFQKVAYEGLSFARRREMHGRVGEALERRGAEPALLSLHFFEAGDYEKAWAQATVAADAARAQFANVVAAELYERALAASDHLDLPDEDVARVWEALGDVARLYADLGRAERAYTRARELAGDSARLLELMARVSELRGDYAESLEWLDRAAATADDDGTASKIENSMAGSLFRQGRYQESLEWSQRAIERAEKAGELSRLAYALLNYDLTLGQIGRGDPSLAPRALELFEQLDDLTGVARTLNNLGITAYYEGRWDEALEYYARSHAAFERTGNVEGATMATFNRGEIFCNQGRYEDAEPLFRDSLRVARAAGSSLIEAFVTGNLGRLAACLLRFEEAHRLLDEAAEKLAAIGSGVVADIDARRAECLVLEGRQRGALPLAERTLSRVRELGRLDTLGPGLERTLGYAFAQDRRPDEAASHLERSLELGRAAQARYEIAMTLNATAEVTGRPSVEAEELFAQLGVVSIPSIPLP